MGTEYIYFKIYDNSSKGDNFVRALESIKKGRDHSSVIHLPASSIRAIAVLIAVIVLAAAIGAVYFISHRNQSSYHVATPSQSEVDMATGKNLTEHSTSYIPGSGYTVTSSVVAEYIETANGSTSLNGTLLLASLEFESQSQASTFYAGLYHNTSSEFNATSSPLIINGSYRGFSFFTYQYSQTVSEVRFYEYVAVGQAAQFVYAIVDINVPLSNSTALLDAQMNSMIG